MVQTARDAGFNGADVEFLYFDNSEENNIDAFHGVNRTIRIARGEILIFCHQDIRFEFDDRNCLDRRIKEVENLDENWAVLGNAGKTKYGSDVIRITDPYGKNLKTGSFPAEVFSLDENFLVINRRQNLFCSPQLRGFHLYGTDLCQNANYLGLCSYVIDFHLKHQSAGHADASYFELQKQYIKLLSQRKKPSFIHAMCSDLFASSSTLMIRLLNFTRVLKFHRKLSIKYERLKTSMNKRKSPKS
jgi:hypothetical protein